MSLQSLMASCRDRLARSRFFTVSLTFHVILILVIGQQIVSRYEPPEVIPTATMPETEAIKAPEPKTAVVPPVEQFNPTANPNPLDPTKSLNSEILTPKPTEIVQTIITTQQVTDNSIDTSSYHPLPPTAPNPGPGLTKGDLKNIGDFTKPWRKQGNERFEFTAFIGKYQGGNWSSTVRLKDGEIAAGSLPNLLYAMSKWSKDRIQTNERKVKAIALDSSELLTEHPPFVFLTGTKDFKLTEKEVENLRIYIRSGGAVWGDSSVPGQRSAFDNAFKREMRRVMGENSSFEPLAANHPVFTNGYFSRVKQLPAGINNYQEPVEVLRWGGEIAVIHTINDYGDMWQIGLDQEGKIDLSRNAGGEYVAMNATLWDNRGIYVRNIEQPAVEQAYRFGINMVMHLLTRWESRVGGAATL